MQSTTSTACSHPCRTFQTVGGAALPWQCFDAQSDAGQQVSPGQSVLVSGGQAFCIFLNSGAWHYACDCSCRGLLIRSVLALLEELLKCLWHVCSLHPPLYYCSGDVGELLVHQWHY